MRERNSWAVRIIPARAGFTGSRTRSWRGRWDHPRSRGVYGVTARSDQTRAGSSPLARGLRLDPSSPIVGFRIIPARAGFTGPGRRHRPPGPDHPRSRGVYHAFLPPYRDDTGSSPLARGLRRYAHVGVPPPGIIPARAGFTVAELVDALQGGDHPRSRGVYEDSS